jgi:hypothetical protein
MIDKFLKISLRRSISSMRQVARIARMLPLSSPIGKNLAAFAALAER